MNEHTIVKFGCSVLVFCGPVVVVAEQVVSSNNTWSCHPLTIHCRQFLRHPLSQDIVMWPLFVCSLIICVMSESSLTSQWCLTCLGDVV